MIESIILLIIIFSAVYLATELGAHLFFSYVAATVFLAFAALWLSSITAQVLWHLFLLKNTYVSAALLLIFLVILSYLTYRISASKWGTKSSKYLFAGHQILASIFLALVFTLSLSYTLRFLQDAGLVPASYAESSLPYKVICHFTKAGDFAIETVHSLFDTAEELTKSNFEPGN